MKVSAIIVAAGSSRRMGFDKLAAEIAGQSVLSRSLAAFQACDAIDEIVLVGSLSPLSENPPAKLRCVVPGGAERHLSVAAGLGIAWLPCFIGDPDARLVRAPGVQPQPDRSIWLLLHDDLRKTARVRAFVDFVSADIVRTMKPYIA